MREKLSPSIYRTEPGPLAVEFSGRDGRIFGIPYSHLLNFLHETNPDSELQPNAPTERVRLSFATHDVILLGWSLRELVPLLCAGQLASVHAVEARYLAAAENSAFVCDISITPASSK